MTDYAAGWYNDPYGRFQQRHWDGQQWTDRVATNGVAQIDPMGASTVVPFAIPPSAYTTPGETTAGFAAVGEPGTPPAPPAPPAPAGKVITFLDGLGPDAKERPEPTLRAAMAGLGGVIIAIGVLIAVVGDEPNRSKFIGVSLATMVAGWALRTFVKLEEAKAAAVGAVVVAIPTFAGAVTVSNGQGGFLTGLMAAALFIGAWALPGFKSRNLLLGLGALALVAGFGSLSANDNADTAKCDQYLNEGDFDRFDAECQNYYDDVGGSGFLPVDVTDNLGTQGIVYLVGAGAFLGLTWWLDRRGYRGTATGLCAAGLASALVGTVLLANEFGDTTGPLLILVVGLLICAVGTHGERRATTWLGAVLAAIGIVSLVAVQMEPSSSSAAGGVAIISGLLLVTIAALSAPIRAAIRKQRDGGTSDGAGGNDGDGGGTNVGNDTNVGNGQPSAFAPPAP